MHKNSYILSMSDRISVAMATYNGAKYLREQLDSLYTQTRVPDEVIVCDDNSTDGTAEILEDYKHRYGLIYSINPKSLGVNKNFEKALHSCGGDYIMICDQDDIWLHNKIEISFKYMHELEDKWGKGCPLLVTSEASSYIDGDFVNLEDRPNYGEIIDYREFLFNSDQHCQGCTMLMNRNLLDILPSFPGSFNHYPYDAHIAVVSLLIGKRCHIKQDLMCYRHHLNNVVCNIKRESIIDRLNKKMSPIVYSFYGIPYPRQKYYSEIVDGHRIQMINGDVIEDVVAIVQFAKSSLIGKLKAIMSVNGIGRTIRLKQLFATFFTYPFRLFIPRPQI